MKTICALVVVALSLVFAGCDGKGNKPSKLQLKFGIQKVLANYPVELAKEDGLFDNTGIEIELIEFQSANDALDALLADRIVSDAVMPFQMLFGVETRAPGSVRCFGAMIATPEEPLETFIVRADSKIETEQQLAQAKIGVFPGTFASSLTRLALGPSVSIQEIPQSAQAEALARGAVDALVAYDPLATHLIQDAQAKLFAKGLWEKKLGTFAVGGYCVTKTMLANQRDVALKLQQTLTRAVELYNSDPDAALKLLTPVFTLRPALRNQYSVAKTVFGRQLSTELLRSTYELYQRAGIVTGQCDPAQLVLNDL